MEGLATLIMICFLITFGPPVIFFIIGIAKRNTNRDSSKTFLILAALWLIVGGGICASLLT
jgi:hypothetical protein